MSLQKGSTSGADGSFAITDVAPGTYRLLARLDGYAGAETPVQLVSADGSATVAQSIQVPGPPVRIVLPLTATLIVSAPGFTGDASVTITGSDGQPFRGLGFGSPMERWPLFGGSARIEGLPPGQWRLRITTAGGETRETPVSVSPGATARVEIR